MKNHLYYIYWLIRTLPMRWNFPKYQIMSIEETIDDIIQNKKSISRLGDADFLLLISARDVSYQDLSREITTRLKEVVQCRDPRFLIALPDTINDTRALKRDSKIHWKMFINTHGKMLSKHLDKEYQYGNSNMTRFYIDGKYKKKSPQLFTKLQTIWEGRDVIIIEGEYSRLGVNNDLFSNVNSLKRILAPHKNAFAIYHQLKEMLLQYPKDLLFLFSLGPTATILCCELAQAGYWAVDIGNIDLEYMWLKLGATEKVPVKGRFSVETGNNLTEDLMLEPGEHTMYYESIIKKF